MTWEHVVMVLMGAVILAKIYTALTPTPKDDEKIAKVYKLVEMLALNVGRAKERGDGK